MKKSIHDYIYYDGPTNWREILRDLFFCGVTVFCILLFVNYFNTAPVLTVTIILSIISLILVFKYPLARKIVKKIIQVLIGIGCLAGMYAVFPTGITDKPIGLITLGELFRVILSGIFLTFFFASMGFVFGLINKDEL